MPVRFPDVCSSSTGRSHRTCREIAGNILGSGYHFGTDHIAVAPERTMLPQGDAKIFKKYSQMKLQMKREALGK